MKWLRRNGWRVVQLAVLVWIAVELHRLVGAVGEIPQPDMTGVTNSIDNLRP